MVDMQEVGQTLDLRNELEQLRIRLAEARAALRSFRKGEDQGLLVGSSQLLRLSRPNGTENPFRQMVETLVEGAVFLSGDGRILYSNQQFANILGYTIQDYLNTHFENLACDTNKVLFRSFLEDSLHGPRRLELTLTHKTKRSVNVLLSSSPLELEDTTGVCLTITDLTERQHNEQALREALQRYRVATRSIRDAFIIVDGESGCITWWNLAAEQIFGYSREEMLGKELHELLVPERYRSVARDGLRRFAESGEGGALGKTLELTAMRKGGIEFPIDLSLSSMQLGDKWFGVGIARDITERKKTERSLRESEVELTTAFENIVEAILIFSVDGQLLRCNRAALDIFGFDSVEEFQNAVSAWRRQYDLYTMDGIILPFDQRPLSRVLGGETLENYQYREKRLRDNTQRVISCRGQLARDSDGQPLLAVLSLRDVTQEHQNDRLLRQSQRMEAVGQLTGGIAHDFNNILQVILAYSQFAQRNCPEGSPLQTDLQQILSATNRAVDLTRQLLAFSQRTAITIAPMDVRPVMKELVKLLERTIPTSISLSYSFARNLPQIVADGTQVHQVLLNLAINARDALPQGGKITFDAYPAHVTEEMARDIFGAVSGDFVVLEVADTGEGIPEENLPLIFEPFFTTKSQGKGTGLGLASAYGIVKQHGGFIVCESTVGVGTKFRLYFPMVTTDTAGGGNAGQEEALQGGNECVLVADDQGAIVSMIRRNLEPLGYKVMCAANGREALDLFSREYERIDLVVLDYQMPEMDGAQCFERIRSVSPSTRVILTTGFLDKEVQDRLHQLGVTKILLKPYAYEELVLAIREVLDA